MEQQQQPTVARQQQMMATKQQQHQQQQQRQLSFSSSRQQQMVASFDPWRRVYVPWAAEFLGTLLFTLFSDMLATLLDNGHSLASIALFEAALLLALVLAFGPFCGGGHFNPAITLASLLSLGTPLLLGLSILVAQLFGAFLGSLLFRSILSNSAFLDAFSRLGVLRVLPTAAEDGTAEEQLLVPTLVTNGLGRDGLGLSSPFAGRFQVFLVELLLSSLLVLVHLFTSLFGPQPIMSVAVCSSAVRSLATAIGARSPLGQSANLARTLANSVLAAIFTRADEFAIWRLFHLHLFAAICSAVVGAAIFWLVKYALDASEMAEAEQLRREARLAADNH